MDDIKKTHEEAEQNARTAVSEAADWLHAALDGYQAAVSRSLRAQLRLCDTPEAGVHVLGRVIYSNPASASGGPAHARNVMEAIQRDTAIALLPQQVNKIL